MHSLSLIRLMLSTPNRLTTNMIANIEALLHVVLVIRVGKCLLLAEGITVATLDDESKATNEVARSPWSQAEAANRLKGLVITLSMAL